MLTKSGSTSRRMVYPLEPQEFAQADRIGLRLADALQAFFSGVSTTDRSVRAYATVLGVDRNICQRSLSTFESSNNGIQAINKAPGVEGLQLLVEAGRVHGVAARPLKQLEATTTQLAELIGELAGGSRQRLLRRIEAAQVVRTSETDSAGSTRAMRMRLFREAAQITGCHCELKAYTILTRPHPTRANEFEQVMMGAYLGYRARPGSLPLTVMCQTEILRPGLEPGTRPPLKEAELVEQFCSSQPTLSAREARDRHIYVVDPPAKGWGTDSQGVDVVVAMGNRIVDVPDEPPQSCMRSFRVRIQQPIEHLLKTIYVHRDMLVGAVPHASVHTAIHESPSEPIGAWDTRLPDPLTLSLLGPGHHNAGSARWANQGEAVRWLFDRVGWNPMDFVGYRVDVEFPLWGCDYITWLDYRPPGEIDMM